MPAEAAPACDSAGAGTTRRYAEGTAAVAVWMAIGLAFHLSANGYLLLGIPITVGFQLYVRRAPLRAMWVRAAPPVRLGATGAAIAIGLMVLPLMDLAGSVRSRSSWVIDGWYIAAACGAWAAAYALRNFKRETLRELLICLGTAGAVGCTIMAATALAGGASHEALWPRLRIGAASFAEYVPVAFILEEVWFRGVLDSHLHHPGEARGAVSAIYVSALWGVWHYPITTAPHRVQDLPATLATLLVVHISIGVLLCWSWRRSGNLFVPGCVHALIDGVRNALIGVPG